MSQRYEEARQHVINEILANMPDQEAQQQRTLFTRQFYESLALEDLNELEPTLAAQIADMVYDQHHQPCDTNRPSIHITTPDCLKQHYGRTRLAITVISHDMPFLVDSLTIALKRLEFSLYRLVHPQLRVERDANGAVTTLHATNEEAGHNESCMYFEISPLPQGLSEDELEAKLRESLHFVEHAVSDWRVMMAKAREINTHVMMANEALSDEERQEASDFFDWLLDNNFIFLGFVAYDFVEQEGHDYFTPIEDSLLGIFKINESDLLHRGLASLPPEVRHFARQTTPIEITKSNRRSLVHRDVLMDYIGVKRYDTQGNVIGENRFLGLFTSPVYYQETTQIPYIRQKIRYVMEAAGFNRSGHSGKALKAALEFFPRDELFQICADDLLTISLGIVSLEERPDIRVFFRRDLFERFISCFVFMPRDKYNTYVRRQVGLTLEKHLNGHIDIFYTQLTDSALARVNYIIRTTPGHIPEIDRQTLNQELSFIISYWVESLREALMTQFGEQQGEALYRCFGEAFPRSYSNNTAIEHAIEDIERLQSVIRCNQPAFHLFVSEKSDAWHLKMYAYPDEMPLSATLPMLENLGFTVRDMTSHTITPQQPVETDSDMPEIPGAMLIRDFKLEPQQQGRGNFEEIKPLIEEVLAQVWTQRLDDDGLNALAATAAMNARQIMLMRSYAAYARQVPLSYSGSYMTKVLCNHAGITARISQYFALRFDPAEDTDRQKRCDETRKQLDEALSEVANLAEDRILRFFVNAVKATLRTNYYQDDENGHRKPYIALKLDSSLVPNLPLPRPFREIFVYSKTTEGVHLRGGEVARGGLRWSDRHEDYRTEVLGLMKAQMVKNAVIVPTGSKGGFVVREAQALSGREERMRAGIASYRQYLSGLLDITDNRRGEEIVPPRQVVRHDGDDPYLVVAADKGTATFSDIANDVAISYDFWLGDAFASGGSDGYDHKKMGITARGAWVSVERHFSELGIDISKEPITVAGIGDMAGDVFGNGMLLSDKLKLVAAFNHLHIFLDPNPDPQTSFEERQRLFTQARGSWDQYNSELISKGGGVFSRQEKSITLTDEMQRLLDTDERQVTPNTLIRLILKSPVDLLWNGGIGTYVKAQSESQESVGDPNNNTVRVDGAELRCRVIGEGGNLGLTQPGRIEYARHGGRLNTDAIDNSAGVDCSDHEVNIKIALNKAMEDADLAREERNSLLGEMDSDVAALVLRDNHQQNQALSIAESRAAQQLELHSQFLEYLEDSGLLDREVEHLPSEKQLANLKADGLGLSRPELAVVMSYSKMDLYRELAGSMLVSADIFVPDILGYFPPALQERYRETLLAHPLRREIVATCLSNEIINHAGLTYIYSIAQDTGHTICNIVRAYVVVRDVFGIDTLWAEVEALNGSVQAGVQVELFTGLTRFMHRLTIWFLNNNVQPMKMEETVAAFKPRVDYFIDKLDTIASYSVRDAQDDYVRELTNKGVSEELATRLSRLGVLISGCDIAMIDRTMPQSQLIIGQIYYELGARLQLGWLRHFISEFPAESYWDRLAIRNAISELYEEQRRLTESVLDVLCDDDTCSTTIDRWVEENQSDLERFQRLVHKMKTAEEHDLAMVIVAMRQLSRIQSGGGHVKKQAG